jgi:hypothetical protein
VKVSRFETGQIVVIVTQRRIVSLIFMENIENMMGLRGRMLKSPRIPESLTCRWDRGRYKLHEVRGRPSAKGIRAYNRH